MMAMASKKSGLNKSSSLSVGCKVLTPAVSLTAATTFSKLDANCGFWQIPLAKESQHFTTFITPFGQYCFQKLPFGSSSAPEHFQTQMCDILEREEGVLCHIDDILVFGHTPRNMTSGCSGLRRRSRMLESH